MEDKLSSDNSAAKAQIATKPGEKTFFGQPLVLRTLFMTEFWERFSYYGMRAILLFYMYDAVAHGGLGMNVKLATAIMAIYGSLVYMTSIIGGFISDRITGTAKAILYGGILIMIGHIILAMPIGKGALFASIALITLGTGLLKTNVSETVGSLYEPGDLRRDSGYSIFVIGINLGSLLAPFLVSYIGQTYNYHVGFSLATLGMALGLIVYIHHYQQLPASSKMPTDPLTPSQRKKLLTKVVIGIGSIAAALLILNAFHVLTGNGIVNTITIIGVVLPIVYFIVMFRSAKVTATEKRHLHAYIYVFIAEVVFCMVLEQATVVLTLFAQNQVQLNIAGFHFQSGQFQSLNPLFIIIYSPLFALLWTRLGKRQPTAATKFSWSLIFTGIAFMVMILPVWLHGTHTRVTFLWLVLSWGIMEVGELLMSPIGLSVTSKLAPQAFKSQMMSMWFLGNAAAQAVNAQIMPYFTPPNEIIYFGLVGGFTVVVGLLLMLLIPKTNRLMA